MNFRETEKLIKKDGWFFIESDGSHYHYKHPFKKGKVTIPYHGSKDIKIETMNSILKQAGLK